jgi:hypothetical protein
MLSFGLRFEMVALFGFGEKFRRAAEGVLLLLFMLDIEELEATVLSADKDATEDVRTACLPFPPKEPVLTNADAVVADMELMGIGICCCCN